jgi:hypothetical protein
LAVVFFNLLTVCNYFQTQQLGKARVLNNFRLETYNFKAARKKSEKSLDNLLEFARIWLILQPKQRL